MWSYLVRRLLLAVPTVLGVSIVAFVLVALSPGDPALAVLGDHYTKAEYIAERERQGLDQPLPLRYVRWAGLVLRGDLGRSTKTKRPVTDDKKRVRGGSRCTDWSSQRRKCSAAGPISGEW